MTEAEKEALITDRRERQGTLERGFAGGDSSVRWPVYSPLRWLKRILLLIEAFFCLQTQGIGLTMKITDPRGKRTIRAVARSIHPLTIERKPNENPSQFASFGLACRTAGEAFPPQAAKPIIAITCDGWDANFTGYMRGARPRAG